METLERRLEIIEEKLHTLHEQDLFVARTLALELSATLYDLGLTFASLQEDSKIWHAYIETMGVRLNKIRENIEKAQNVGEAIRELAEFHTEFYNFLKVIKVATAGKAMDIAHSFIKKFSPVALPLKAVRGDDIWLVDVDIGVLAVKVAKVKIDARTGNILSYEIPPK